MDSDNQQLLNRLQETVEARIQGMAQNRYDIDETSVASLAAHFTAMRAVESYIDETLLIRTASA